MSFEPDNHLLEALRDGWRGVNLHGVSDQSCVGFIAALKFGSLQLPKLRDLIERLTTYEPRGHEINSELVRLLWRLEEFSLVYLDALYSKGKITSELCMTLKNDISY